MKICGIIAEYNPLHNGHLILLKYAKEVLKADKIVVCMSGNFSQRGEATVMNKYTRAKHAIKAGADMVVELPTVFAVGNAEIFAKGAVKVLDSLGIIDTLCFGVESGDRQDYISTAKALMVETKEFKHALKKHLEKGLSFAKARIEALKDIKMDGVNEDLTLSPNNILGLEYTKAILAINSKMDISPFVRQGDHNDTTLYKNVTSATSIRLGLDKSKSKVKKVLPPYVYKDLPKKPLDFSKIIMSAMLSSDTDSLEELPDCTEGLHNRIKALCYSNYDYKTALSKITTKRYTTSRIRRIFISNLLKITTSKQQKALKDKTYQKVLAVRSDFLPIISRIKEQGNALILTRKNDYKSLSKTALFCFEIDKVANHIYNLIADENSNEFYTEIIAEEPIVAKQKPKKEKKVKPPKQKPQKTDDKNDNVTVLSDK